MNHAIDLAVGCSYFLPGLRLPPQLSPDGATCIRQHTSDSSLLLIYRPRKDERLSWPSWLTYRLADGLPTLVVTHQLQVERRTGKVRQSETDVLPLCHATNHTTLPLIACFLTSMFHKVVWQHIQDVVGFCTCTSLSS